MVKYENLVASIGIKSTSDRDELEDFVQEVFILAYQSLSKFRGEAQFSTYLYQIARNHASHFFKSKNTIQIEDIKTFDLLKLSSLEKQRSLSNSNPEYDTIKEDFHQKIRNYVGKLPIQYKRPIEMLYFDNRSYKEISEMLNVKLNTLKSTIFRGKEILKGMLKHEKE
jgi:RNA polymerase sigma-70 factor (ECF subfamily)